MSSITQDGTVLRAKDQFQMNLSTVATPNKPFVGGQTLSGEASGQLFYWSHSKFERDFEFGLHHHEGFEIVTYILEGRNSHFDTATKQWKDLLAGDMQIIFAGSGISHNEKVSKGSRAFQIWFDPNYFDAVSQPPHYQDLSFKEIGGDQVSQLKIINLAGPNSDVMPRTPGLSLTRIQAPLKTSHSFSMDSNKRFVYVIFGVIQHGEHEIKENELLILNSEDNREIQLAEGADIFVVTLPQNPSYQPVIERR
jgi:redox-sensitive bicupin YhaK (pirin superfamily)